MSPWSANPMKSLMRRKNDNILVWLDKAVLYCTSYIRIGTHYILVSQMSKPCDKSKEQVRFRRERNLVAKNNYHKGGYHTPGRFERKCKLVLPHGGISIKEINEWWELSI